jgi:DeoR family transcriptional regulator, copper-sensing transcriptional repressor
MNTSPTNREKQILEQLKGQGSTSIQELADHLGVSIMTVHRDLNRLADTGHIHKRHGSVSLASGSSETVGNPCAMCGKNVVGQKVFIVHLENGEQRVACCAHCGLMLYEQTKNAWQAMTTDFLHNHMISANQAIYLIECHLNVCCVPSVLSFGSRREAEQFQTGFGGETVNINEAIEYLLGTQHSHQ